jgi:hypothetical protein
MRRVMAEPMWSAGRYWDPRDVTPAVEQRLAARSWTMKDWGLGLVVWNRINIVLWHALFVERNSSRFATGRAA